MRERLDDVLARVDDPGAVADALAALNDAARRTARGASRREGGRMTERVTTSWLRRLWPFLARHRRKVLRRVRRVAGHDAHHRVHPAHRARGRRQRDRRPDQQALWPLLALLVGLGAVNFVLSYIRRFTGGRFAFDVQHDLRTTIFERRATPRLRPPRPAPHRPDRVARELRPRPRPGAAELPPDARPATSCCWCCRWS